MKKILAAFALAVLAVFSPSLWQASENGFEIFSQQDDWVNGYNSALRQFAPEDVFEKMYIGKSETKSVKYVVEKENEEDGLPYAEGYHKALELLFRFECTR